MAAVRNCKTSLKHVPVRITNFPEILVLIRHTSRDQLVILNRKHQHFCLLFLWKFSLFQFTLIWYLKRPSLCAASAYSTKRWMNGWVRHCKNICSLAPGAQCFLVNTRIGHTISFYSYKFHLPYTKALVLTLLYPIWLKQNLCFNDFQFVGVILFPWKYWYNLP